MPTLKEHMSDFTVIQLRDPSDHLLTQHSLDTDQNTCWVPGLGGRPGGCHGEKTGTNEWLKFLNGK